MIWLVLRWIADTFLSSSGWPDPDQSSIRGLVYSWDCQLRVIFLTQTKGMTRCAQSSHKGPFCMEPVDRGGQIEWTLPWTLVLKLAESTGYIPFDSSTRSQRSWEVPIPIHHLVLNDFYEMPGNFLMDNNSLSLYNLGLFQRDFYLAMMVLASF